MHSKNTCITTFKQIFAKYRNSLHLANLTSCFDYRRDQKYSQAGVLYVLSPDYVAMNMRMHIQPKVLINIGITCCEPQFPRAFILGIKCINSTRETLDIHVYSPKTKYHHICR